MNKDSKIDFSLSGMKQFRNDVLSYIDENRVSLDNVQVLMLCCSLGLVLYEPAEDEISRRKIRSIDNGKSKRNAEKRSDVDLGNIRLQFMADHNIGREICIIPREVAINFYSSASVLLMSDLMRLRNLSNRNAASFQRECDSRIEGRITQDIRFLTLGLITLDVKPVIGLFQYLHSNATCDRLQDGQAYSIEDKCIYEEFDLENLIAKTDIVKIGSRTLSYISQINVYNRRYVNVYGRGSLLLQGERSQRLVEHSSVTTKRPQFRTLTMQSELGGDIDTMNKTLQSVLTMKLKSEKVTKRLDARMTTSDVETSLGMIDMLSNVVQGRETSSSQFGGKNNHTTVKTSSSTNMVVRDVESASKEQSDPANDSW